MLVKGPPGDAYVTCAIKYTHGICWACFCCDNVNTFCRSLGYIYALFTRLCFYQTGSAQSMDQGSTKKRSAVHNCAPTVTKFCVMWEGQALSHDTKFGNCRCEIVGRRVIFIWSLIHGSSWSGLIKAEPGLFSWHWEMYKFTLMPVKWSWRIWASTCT